jgi:thioredoxin 1
MAVVELTKDNFEQVITSNPTVIVDYWAPWCGPCRGFAPVFERVAEQHPDVVFAKVNTDEEQEIASHFQIRSIPTLMVFRDQIIVFSQPGALPQNALEQVIAKAKELDMDEVRQQIGKHEGAQEGAPQGQQGSTAPAA